MTLVYILTVIVLSALSTAALVFNRNAGRNRKAMERWER